MNHKMEHDVKRLVHVLEKLIGPNAPYPTKPELEAHKRRGMFRARLHALVLNAKRELPGAAR